MEKRKCNNCGKMTDNREAHSCRECGQNYCERCSQENSHSCKGCNNELEAAKFRAFENMNFSKLGKL